LGGGATGCCAESVKAMPQKRNAASNFLMFMILPFFHDKGGSRDSLRASAVERTTL
jgi:hypothetical protein